jgi:DNA-binding transcriptional MocR family regulator
VQAFGGCARLEPVGPTGTPSGCPDGNHHRHRRSLPQFEQLIEQIKAARLRVCSSRATPCLSIRQLANDLALNSKTVAKAYSCWNAIRSLKPRATAVPMSIPRPYEAMAQSGTRIRNGLTIRAFSLRLIQTVRDILRSGGFPVVIASSSRRCSLDAALEGSQNRRERSSVM